MDAQRLYTPSGMSPAGSERACLVVGDKSPQCTSAAHLSVRSSSADLAASRSLCCFRWAFGFWQSLVAASKCSAESSARARASSSCCCCWLGSALLLLPLLLLLLLLLLFWCCCCRRRSNRCLPMLFAEGAFSKELPSLPRKPPRSEPALREDAPAPVRAPPLAQAHVGCASVHERAGGS